MQSKATLPRCTRLVRFIEARHLSVHHSSWLVMDINTLVLFPKNRQTKPMSLHPTFLSSKTPKPLNMRMQSKHAKMDNKKSTLTHGHPLFSDSQVSSRNIRKSLNDPSTHSSHLAIRICMWHTPLLFLCRPLLSSGRPQSPTIHASALRRRSAAVIHSY